MRHRIRALIWRSWYLLRWRLIDSRKIDGIDFARVAGIDVVVLAGVFHPALFFSSELLVRGIRRAPLSPVSRVLDVGTGSGIAAIAAARSGALVTAVDLQPVGVRCARANALIHEVDDRVDVRLGDLFEAVAGERFDLITFNPPYLLGEPVSEFDLAFHAPAALAERFASQLRTHLAPGGSALIVLSTNGGAGRFLAPLRQAGFRADALLRRDRGSEVLTVWQIRGE